MLEARIAALEEKLRSATVDRREADRYGRRLDRLQGPRQGPEVGPVGRLPDRRLGGGRSGREQALERVARGLRPDGQEARRRRERRRPPRAGAQAEDHQDRRLVLPRPALDSVGEPDAPVSSRPDRCVPARSNAPAYTCGRHCGADWSPPASRRHAGRRPARRAAPEARRASRAAGVDPFPPSFPDRSRDRRRARALRRPRGRARRPRTPTVLAGRLSARRGHGKAAFLDLVDRTGRIQLHARKDVLGDAYEGLVDLDLGDLVGVEGAPFRTRRGELSLRVDGWTLLAQVAAAAARQVPRPDRRRDPLPAARARPARERGDARALHHAQPPGRGGPPLPRRARLPRGRDAGAAAALRRRARPAVHHAPQRARPRRSTCGSRPSST